MSLSHARRRELRKLITRRTGEYLKLTDTTGLADHESAALTEDEHDFCLKVVSTIGVELIGRSSR